MSGKVNGIFTPFDDHIVDPATPQSGDMAKMGGFNLADGRQATSGETGSGANFVNLKDQPNSIEKAGASIKGS